MLLVTNLSGEPNVNLALNAPNATAVAGQQFSVTQRSWLIHVSLATGTFTLDGANSEHHCKIDID